MTCSTCNKRPVRGPDQRVCKECHAEYMRGYRLTSKQRAHIKSFLQGYNALRDDLTATFKRIGEGEMTGYTALEIVKNSKPIVARGTLPDVYT